MSDSLVHLIAKSERPDAGLLIMLHGVGSNENDLFTLSRFFKPWCHVVSLRAPIWVMALAGLKLSSDPRETKSMPNQKSKVV